jgi:hypothetical protein
MEAISAILVMLMAVVASGVFARMSPAPLPLPLVQIVLGALIAYATGFQVQLDPDIFFLLFLPPLLFLDGWRMPNALELAGRYAGTSGCDQRNYCIHAPPKASQFIVFTRDALLRRFHHGEPRNERDRCAEFFAASRPPS